jgi:uncharacterized protein (DUF488 family)
VSSGEHEHPPLRIWTLGHSNRPLETFLELVRSGGIERIADVRRYPRSRRQPHFSRERLERSLAAIGVGYVHLAELGGHREPHPDSPHAALREAAFRGYADHMQTPAFAAALERLLALARERRSALMCAEARWQSCHRRLLSDRLVAAGAIVEHLASGAPPERHVLDPRARWESGRLVYRGESGNA